MFTWIQEKLESIRKPSFVAKERNFERELSAENEAYQGISRVRAVKGHSRNSLLAAEYGVFGQALERYGTSVVGALLTVVSVLAFIHYYQNGLGLAYNDARSHLDIGRRVVEGLNPGAAQLGSVWLPLTHLLMSVTIWNDFMWHSGLAGAIQSMMAFVATGIVIYLFLKEIGVGLLGRFVGVTLFVANINILYLQSTAMTELMLIAMMTAGAYHLLRWFKTENTLYLVYAAFFIMLASLVRYDGWFMFFFATVLISFFIYRKYGYQQAEGLFVFFCTLAGFGVFLWLLWNALIFKDPLFFAYGPYSAHAQQDQLEAAGVLPSKGNWIHAFKVYMYAFAYNVGAFTMFVGFIGAAMLWLNKKIAAPIRLATLVLIAPLLFNVLALYLGHSVLYIQGLSGDTWFNVRYGVMMMPTIAIFVGYLVHTLVPLRPVVIGLLCFVTFFQFASADAVTIDDARVGSSQKNVTEVSGWLARNTADKPGFILISAASHDSIIFSSGLPMKRFIHEGAGPYYDSAIINPDRWARFIVVRSHSDTDSTWRLLKDNRGFTEYYEKVDSYPFADIYELRPEHLPSLITEPILKKRW